MTNNELPSLQKSSKAETFEHSTEIDNTVEARTAIAKTGQSEWSCTLCDKTLTSEQGLKYHFESKHGRGKKYPCKQCDYSAPKQSTLLVHIRSIHEGIKYPCNYCDHKATQIGNLKYHIKAKHGSS